MQGVIACLTIDKVGAVERLDAVGAVVADEPIGKDGPAQVFDGSKGVLPLTAGDTSGEVRAYTAFEATFKGDPIPARAPFYRITPARRFEEVVAAAAAKLVIARTASMWSPPVPPSNRSRPERPQRTSSPPSPRTTSLPPPASITSRPGVPSRRSLPDVPRIVTSWL